MGANITLCVHFSYSSEVKSQRAFHIHSCLASCSACPVFKMAWQERNYNRWGEFRWEDSANKDQHWQSSQREEEQDSEAQEEWQASSGAKKLRRTTTVTEEVLQEPAHEVPRMPAPPPSSSSTTSTSSRSNPYARHPPPPPPPHALENVAPQIVPMEGLEGGAIKESLIRRFLDDLLEDHVFKDWFKDVVVNSRSHELMDVIQKVATRVNAAKPDNQRQCGEDRQKPQQTQVERARAIRDAKAPPTIMPLSPTPKASSLVIGAIQKRRRSPSVVKGAMPKKKADGNQPLLGSSATRGSRK